MRRRAQRIAAIDVGTNSIHMVIVERHRHGYRIVDREKEMVQLGRGSLEGRPLTDEAIERGVAALRTMAGIADRWNVQQILAVATSAMREAPNRRRFITAAEAEAGIKVRVISGEEEADYIYRAVRSAVDFHDGTALVIDIGGGSTEVIVGRSDEVYFTASEALGALRMAQQFGLEGAGREERVEACRKHVRRAMKKAIARANAIGFDFAVGTSGTIVTLSEIAGAASAEEVSSGLRWLAKDRLAETIELLAPLTAKERAARFGVDERRSETLLAGAIVLHTLMDGLGIEQLRACDAALREGIIEYVIDREEGERATQGPSGSVRRSSVLALAERSEVDQSHAAHVARLALRVFDQTVEIHHLRAGERELLEYAALLHEVGTHVSYQGHHKHSYYLISHAGLRGFTTDQVSLVANVARYYRKAAPSEEHSNFASLTRGQKDTVRRLSAILRVADGLDRSRRGVVRDVAVDDREGILTFRLRLRGDAEIELAAAAKRARYLGKVFERHVDFEITS